MRIGVAQHIVATSDSSRLNLTAACLRPERESRQPSYGTPTSSLTRGENRRPIQYADPRSPAATMRSACEYRRMVASTILRPGFPAGFRCSGKHRVRVGKGLNCGCPGSRVNRVRRRAVRRRRQAPHRRGLGNTLQLQLPILLSEPLSSACCTQSSKQRTLRTKRNDQSPRPQATRSEASELRPVAA